jgi:hypothetical protein
MNGVGPAVLLTRRILVSSACVALDGCKLRTRVVAATTMDRTRAALWRLWFIFWLDEFMEFKPLSGFPRPKSDAVTVVNISEQRIAAKGSVFIVISGLEPMRRDYYRSKLAPGKAQ